MGSTSRAGAAGKLVALLAAFVATSVVAGVLAAGLVMPAVGATGSLARSSVEFFDSLPEELEPQPLSQQSRVLWADGSTMATFYDQNRIVVPLSAVAPVLRQAVIAIEDSRFYEHGGVDARGIARAAVNNLTGGDTQGASTLTQQWIKNVLAEEALREGGREAYQQVVDDDYGRKMREVKLAIAADKRLSKDQILENYLNIALFGDGQYGIATAAQHFFNKSAADLTLPEAALLAGMIQRPTYFDPVANPERATERRNVVLARMLELGLIDRAQYEEAVAVPLEAMLQVQESRNGCEQAGSAAFFCSYVIETILQDPAFGETPEDRQQLIYRGGLTITTTLDKPRQEAADAAVKQAVLPEEPVAAALVSVQPGTGRIVAMAQSKYYDPRESAGIAGTSLNYSVDAAMGGPPDGFQVGSTYKPFVLATWLKQGKSLLSRVGSPRSPQYNVKNDFTYGCVDDQAIASEAWNPGNSEGQGGGRITALEATYRSVNTAYSEMARQLDLCQVRDTAASLGVHRTNGNELSFMPASILGSNEIAPLTMASAFAAFARSGTYCKPLAIAEVRNSSGEVIGGQPQECTQAIEPEVADAVASALTNTLDRGTARGSDIGWPAAGKTGTTNNSTETWFVGFTRQLAAAVWVGTPNREPSSLNGQTIGGQPRSRVYGGTIAAPTWRAYMDAAMQGFPREEFPPVASRFTRDPNPPRPQPTRTSSSRDSDQPSRNQPSPEQPPAEQDGGGGDDGGEDGNGGGGDDD